MAIGLNARSERGDGGGGVGKHLIAVGNTSRVCAAGAQVIFTKRLRLVIGVLVAGDACTQAT